jgi:chromosome segregation ATPase
MPSKKQPPRPGPPWQIILEEIRSQNRATIEAVEVTREVLEGRMVGLQERIDRLELDTRVRDAALETMIRELKVSVQQNSADIRQLQGDVSGLQGNVTVLQGDVRVLQGDVRVLQGDVRGLAAKVEVLAHLDERITAIEKRLA